MAEYEGIKIVHTYKGKKVTHTFFKNNKHLFTEPPLYLLESAIELLKRIKDNTKKHTVYIDESGKIGFSDPG